MTKKVGIIIGSTRDGRISRSIAEHVLELAKNSGQSTYELIDLKEVNLPFTNEPFPPAMGKYQNESTKAWAKTIAGFDGFIIVSSEYNYGYPAPLKNALDAIYAEWNDKPVTFVGYGYSAKGGRALAQLRQVAECLKLKPTAQDVQISLGSNLKDGVFHSDEQLDKILQASVGDLEKELV